MNQWSLNQNFRMSSQPVQT